MVADVAASAAVVLVASHTAEDAVVADVVSVTATIVVHAKTVALVKIVETAHLAKTVAHVATSVDATIVHLATIAAVSVDATTVLLVVTAHQLVAQALATAVLAALVAHVALQPQARSAQHAVTNQSVRPVLGTWSSTGQNG